jgi:hypothetical protein
MTWEQFVALALGLAATALIRLLDKYLPPSEAHPALATEVGAEYANTEPMAGVPRPPTRPAPAEESGPDPPPGYQRPTRSP